MNIIIHHAMIYLKIKTIGLLHTHTPIDIEQDNCRIIINL